MHYESHGLQLEMWVNTNAMSVCSYTEQMRCGGVSIHIVAKRIRLFARVLNTLTHIKLLYMIVVITLQAKEEYNYQHDKRR